MNIQLTPQLYFSNTASAAGVVIPRSGVAALLSPVVTIVRLIAAFPVEVVLTRNAPALRPPFAFTRAGAEFVCVLAGLFDLVLFAALKAILCDALLKAQIFASDIGARDAFQGLSKESAETDHAAKVTLRLFQVSSLLHKQLTAVIAGQFCEPNTIRPFTKILSSVYGGITFLRTEFTRPRFVVLKFFTALRAIGSCFRCFTVAFFRAVHLSFGIVRRVITKFFSALRTNGFFHFSPLKEPALCKSASLSRCAGKGLARETKRSRTATPRHTYCNTLGGNHGRT